MPEEIFPRKDNILTPPKIPHPNNRSEVDALNDFITIKLIKFRFVF